MSGGFTPKLKRTGDLAASSVSFLASEHAMYKRDGITVDAATVGASLDGNKILVAGTVMGKITASGKYAAYSNGLSNGREVADGFLPEAINLKDGDVICGLLIHGSVIASRTSGLDAPARVDLAGRIIFQ